MVTTVGNLTFRVCFSKSLSKRHENSGCFTVDICRFTQCLAPCPINRKILLKIRQTNRKKIQTGKLLCLRQPRDQLITRTVEIFDFVFYYSQHQKNFFKYTNLSAELLRCVIPHQNTGKTQSNKGDCFHAYHSQI